jgi:hypothetical protein
MRCEECKHWTRTPNQVDGHCDRILINPRGPREPNTLVLLTRGSIWLVSGRDFGCIHFEALDEVR